MILIIRDKQIIYEVDRYEIVDVKGERDLIKCYPDASDKFFYIGEDDRLTFEYVVNPILPSDYKEEDSEKNRRYIYEYDKLTSEFKKVIK